MEVWGWVTDGMGLYVMDGVGYAYKIDGRMDGDLYLKVLDDELQETITYHNKTKDDIIFQQDNDPKHACKKARKWFQDHFFHVMEWQHNLQISIPLSISSITWRGGWQSMSRNLKES